MEELKNLPKEPELKDSPMLAPDRPLREMAIAESAKPAEPKAETPKAETLKAETLKAETPNSDIKADVKPNLTVAPKADKVDTEKRDANQPLIAATVSSAPRSRSHRFALLAASLALAGALGAMLGSLGSAGIMRYALAPQSAANAPQNGARFDQATAQLRADVAALRGLVETSGKNANAQFTRLTERLDRADRAHGDPSAKLTQIMTSLERIERHSGITSAAATPVNAETTGSIKQATATEAKKPPVLQGWIVRDMYAGRALIEGRQGTLFEVGPGSNLPGLGRIESIKRRDGQWVVTTPKGIIASAIEPHRRPY